MFACLFCCRPRIFHWKFNAISTTLNSLLSMLESSGKCEQMFVIRQALMATASFLQITCVLTLRTQVDDLGILAWFQWLFYGKSMHGTAYYIVKLQLGNFLHWMTYFFQTSVLKENKMNALPITLPTIVFLWGSG